MRRVRRHEHGVAIRRRAHDVLRCRNAVPARNVFDKNAATERRRHAVRKQSRQRVGRASRREGYHEANVLRWIGVLCAGASSSKKTYGGQENDDAFVHYDLLEGIIPSTRFYTLVLHVVGEPGATSTPTMTGMSSTMNDSDLPWPSRPMLALTPPSSTSSRTKLNAASLGRSYRTTRDGLRAAKARATRSAVTCADTAA